MNQLMRNQAKKKTVIFWLAQLKNVNKEPQLSAEHSKYRWLTKEQALEKCQLPEFAEIVNEFDKVAQNP